MELLKIKITVIIILLVILDASSQSGLEIERACLKNGKLKVTFINESSTDVFVPCLSDRYDLNSNNKYLDSRYIKIIGDTLLIVLSKEHPDGLIDSKGNKMKGSKILFSDVTLKPNRRYKSRVRLKSEYEYLKYLVVKYEGWTDSKKLCGVRKVPI